MCRSSRELGGPRRCSAHGRAQLQASMGAVAAWEVHRDQLVERSALERCGLRVDGRGSAADLPVIAARAGRPEEWGFYAPAGRLDLLPADLDDDGAAEQFLDTLCEGERAAITGYTGGWSSAITAALIGDDEVDGQSSVMAAALVDLLARYRRSRPVPAILARGVPAPQPWSDARAFLEAAFPVGARVQTTTIASATHNLPVALEFAEAAPAGYVMVVHAPALPIRPLSTHPWEDESIIGPQHWRCVHVDSAGRATGGVPAVYLVDEELALDAQAASELYAGTTRG